MKLDGKLTITRSRSNTGKGCVRIEIVDAKSGEIAAEVEVAPEVFADALFSLARVPCSVEFNDSGDIGKKREVKQVAIAIPKHNWKDRKKAAREAVKPFEVDGWEGRWEDALNHHNHISGSENAYRVTFIRFV